MRAFLFILVVLTVVLVATNPGPDSYELFVDEVVTETIRSQADGLPGGEAAARLGGMLARDRARRNTERQNFLIFSVYRLDMSAFGLPGEEWRFLGIGTRFFELERPDTLQ